MKDNIERSINVGKTIAKATAEAFKLSASEVTEHFNALQSTFLEKNFSDSEKLEIKRRIAEAMITVLSEKDSFKEFEKAWGYIESLGYSDTERETSMIFYRATFLIKNRVDKNLAEEAINRLEALINSFQEKQLQHLIDHFTQVHNRLINDANLAFKQVIRDRPRII